jgi:dihydroflavonol-4-reductase
MKAVVTGASGLVGSNLALELIAQGHSVRATRRGSSRIDHLAGHPVEWVSADLSEPDALREAFRGADAVFHCAGLVSIRNHVTPVIAATNVEGTRNVVQAARAEGLRRLVHCSTVNAVGLSEDGRPCTETARWNFDEHGLAHGYSITKREAEAVVRREAGDLDWVIVNPCFMFGPYDTKPTSGKVIVDVVCGRIAANVPGFNNFVDVRDVARGMILAFEKGRSGERYILGGENLSY